MPTPPAVRGSPDFLSVTVHDLDGLPGTHEFQVSRQWVHIPGHGGDRDGPTVPDHPAQEAWMRARSGLHESWYLQWDLPDDATRRRFLALLGVEAPGPA